MVRLQIFASQLDPIKYLDTFGGHTDELLGGATINSFRRGMYGRPLWDSNERPTNLIDSSVRSALMLAAVFTPMPTPRRLVDRSLVFRFNSYGDVDVTSPKGARDGRGLRLPIFIDNSFCWIVSAPARQRPDHRPARESVEP